MNRCFLTFYCDPYFLSQIWIFKYSLYICTNLSIYTVLCKKSFHQIHKCLRAVRDGLRTVHELVLYIGIHGYKQSFWVLCAACEQVRELSWGASWASSQSVMSSFVSTEVHKLLRVASWVSSWTVMSSFTSSWTVNT